MTRPDSARPLRRIAIALLAAACLALGWYELGPTALGGRASYVVTDGVSMLPLFEGGGLVVTERQPSYRVGEVVAYHNATLHAVVMHRIIAMDGNRYVFKGDNNHFVDSYHPTKAELVGAERLYLPHVGHYLTYLRIPLVAAVLLGLAAMYAVAGSKLSRRHRRRRHHVVC
ncbi:MAG: signal peptidase I [Acidimicrobiales bacterium]